MGDLNAFLSQNAIKVENRKYVASERFIDGEGKPIAWELKAIDSDRDRQLRKNSAIRVPVIGKKGKATGQYTSETDFNAYTLKLCVETIVFPDLHDAELQNSYGVMGAEELLTTMLTPGEYTDLSSEVGEVNGFDRTFEDKVEEAKN
ncbi:TPA: phage portal protein [Clostridioides difficile]|nr:phage portal protein [Clostridioides difficile]HBG2117993.1 phage portal protein [Clostridioides difficile]